MQKGGPSGIYQHTFSCKISKSSKGGPIGDIKKFQKKSHSAEKIQKGTFTLIRFRRLRLKSKKKTKRGLFGDKKLKKVAQCQKKS